ncbi:MAG: hypothetical protein QXE05_12885 [Nitrososphaeria archaeon]
MAYLEFIIPETLLDKVKEEAKRFYINDKLLMKAAIIAFVENPTDSIKPLPLHYNKEEEELKLIRLDLPEDIAQKVHLYSKIKGFPIRRIISSMVDNFLNLHDERKKFYIDELKTILPSLKVGAWRIIKQKEALASGNLDSLIQVSFKCNKELYELLNDESMKKHIMINVLVRQVVDDFVQKYGNNHEVIKKMHKVANHLFYGKINDRTLDVELSVRILLQLEKISEQTLVPKNDIIRLAIMSHLNLLNESVLERPIFIKNDPPQQNNKDNQAQTDRFINILLPNKLYNLLKRYVMPNYDINKEREIKSIVSNIVAKVITQWAKERFSESGDVETYVVWQIILNDLKTSFYPSLNRGTIVKKQDILDAMTKIKYVLDETRLFETFKERGYLEEIDNDNVKILLL